MSVLFFNFFRIILAILGLPFFYMYFRISLTGPIQDPGWVFDWNDTEFTDPSRNNCHFPDIQFSCLKMWDRL